MKRLLALLLAVCLIFSLTACGGSSGGDVKEPANVDNGNSIVEEQSDAENAEATISETVLVDEAGVKITAKSLQPDEFMGPELKLLIENDSGKDLTFQCRNASVNGYMVETMMSVDVANGKKANDTLTFMNSSLETCSIETIADMEFAFHIFDMSDWGTYLDTDAIRMQTSSAGTFEYTYDDSGELAYEGNGVKIVVKGLSEDSSFFGPSIVVYIENNSDKGITVQSRDVSINGFMVEAMFSCDVTPGKRAVDTITFMETDLTENEITSIEDVELYFHIFDLDSWDTIIDTDVVTIAF